MTVTLGELAVRFGCELRGDPAATVDSVAALSQAGPRSITFLANPKYVAQLAGTRAGAVILDAKSAADSPVPVLVVANPHATYARIATLLHPDPPLHPGVHPTAASRRAPRIDPTAEIAAQAYVGEGARIGARCFIGPGSVIERGADIGDDSRFVARVFVGHHVVFGARCIVQPGAVIGGDGFGFAPEKGTWVKVPQIGGVNVGDDVEIGANTTIDRGALDDTVIEEGVKLDNLIMIAHNVPHRRALGAGRAAWPSPAAAWSASAASSAARWASPATSRCATTWSCWARLSSRTPSASRACILPRCRARRRASGGVSSARIKRLDSMARRLRAVEKHVGSQRHRQGFFRGLTK